jgi:hypothetical protein
VKFGEEIINDPNLNLDGEIHAKTYTITAFCITEMPDPMTGGHTLETKKE